MDDCVDPNDSTTTSNFRCINDPLGDNLPRCLNTCTKPGDTTECRAGRVCVDFGGGNRFCADGPDLTKQDFRCFDQLVNYQVDVGNGFLVSGSSTGILPMVVNKQPTDPSQVAVCDLDANPNRNFRLVSRIPVGVSSVPGAPDPRTRACTGLPASAAALMTFATPPNNPQTEYEQLTLLTQNTPTPDPCFFVGQGSNDQPTGSHVRAFFQNTEIRFILADVERAPSTPIPISFVVHGGYHPQQVISSTAVLISMPARIVLTPVDSQPQNTMPPSTVEAPYLMVVDQRRLGSSVAGGPTRGQLLRINPFGFTATDGYQPLVEDYQHSSGLFPIQ
jgi:hypothetical protein